MTGSGFPYCTAPLTMPGPGPLRSMDKLSFSSDHVNYLILRYLQESGFAHTSYTFYHECQANRADLEPSTVPPGALIHVVQKGLQFIELEANLTQDGTEMDGEYSFLNSKDLITKDVDELRRTVRKRRESVRREKDEKDKTTTFNASGGGAPMDEDTPTPMVVKMENTEIPPHQVTTLRGHSSEVFICAWSPTENLLASGSGDATARIWDLGEGGGCDKPTVLKHVNQQTPGNKSKDVTTMDWSLDGSFLATGSYDGLARIWTKEGELAKTFSSHRGPIFSLKWNKKGGFLLSGSVDHTAIVWDTKTGEAKQKFCFHKAATLDVDWRNNSTFATCSTDKMIYVCKLGEMDPLRTYKGHDNEVNAIMWDPSGRLLASCSDDTTARIWNINQDECVRVLKDHTKEIYTVKWSPAPNANLPLLASASFDTTIKIWDVEHGKCLHNMCRHSESVYSVAFSPDGRFLASGSFDKRVHIWSVFDGSLVKTYNGKGGIFEVCWNKDGDKVAASCSNKVVSVLDIRM